MVKENHEFINEMNKLVDFYKYYPTFFLQFSGQYNVDVNERCLQLNTRLRIRSLNALKIEIGLSFKIIDIFGQDVTDPAPSKG